MNAPAMTFQFDLSTPAAFAELTRVRLVLPAATDDGVEVTAGTCGTVVGVWPMGAAYEVEFTIGLATVEASHLVATE